MKRRARPSGSRLRISGGLLGLLALLVVLVVNAVSSAAPAAVKSASASHACPVATGSGDTTDVFVYGNAALNASAPRPDDGMEMLPGLLPGVHVG